MQKKFDFDRGDLFHFCKSGPVQTGRPPLGEGAVSRRSRYRNVSSRIGRKSYGDRHMYNSRTPFISGLRFWTARAGSFRGDGAAMQLTRPIDHAHLGRM